MENDTNKKFDKKFKLIFIPAAILLFVCSFALSLNLFSHEKVEKKNSKEIENIEAPKEINQEEVNNGKNDINLNDKQNTKIESEKEPEQETKNNHVDFPKMSKEENAIATFSTYFGKYYPINDIKVIDNQDLLYFGLLKTGWKETITKNQIEDALRAYFGNSVQVHHENIKCPSYEAHVLRNENGLLYLYNDEMYHEDTNHGGHGATIKHRIEEVRFMSVSENENILRKNYKVLYGEGCSDICGPSLKFYAHYNDTEPLLDLIGNLTSLTDEQIDELLVQYESKREELMEQLPITSFVYENTSTGQNLIRVEIAEKW